MAALLPMKSESESFDESTEVSKVDVVNMTLLDAFPETFEIHVPEPGTTFALFSAPCASIDGVAWL